MNKIIYLLGIVGLITSYSCSSTYQAGNNRTDDVYYSSKNQPQTTQSANSDNSQYNSQNSSDYSQSNNSDNSQNNNSNNNQPADYVPNGDNTTYSHSSNGLGNSYTTNNYNGDYYDYEYSSRIRRFYTPAYGYSYYDPYYTNSYWYNYNPASWGVSIYLGYNWWAPSSFYYDPFCYGGFSVGFNYNPYWGYNPYPYYYGGYYPPYYTGYNNGYYGGYYGGCTNPYYYNSYDVTSHYYGPRGSEGSNSPRSSSQRQNNIAPLSAKYEEAVSNGRVARSPINEVYKPEILNQERYNINKEKLPATNNKENRNNQTDLRGNTNTKTNSNIPVNQDVMPSINNQEKSNSRSNTNDSRNSNQEINNGNNNSGRKNQNNQDQNNSGSRNLNERTIPDTKPEIDPNNGRSNSRENQYKKDNQRINIDNPKIEQAPKHLEDYLRKRDSRIDMPSRQENKTPVFTPRDQPKQYKQEFSPSPQRSQPAEHNSGGRRK